MFRCFVAALMAFAVPAAAAPPFPLGLYVGNANGSDAAAMADFKAGFDAHNAALGGARPQFFDVFTDFSRDPSTWPSNASWAAWSSAKSGTAYLGPASGIVPIVGIPLAAPGMSYQNVEQFYLNTIAGRYDAVWAGIVDGWANHGYKTVDFRIAYEMNGNFMAWAPSASSAPAATARADFVRAFRHAATKIREQAAKRGMRAMIHWNPAAINWGPYNTLDVYPGDAYVDVIAIDQYSPMWPLDLTDWSTGAKVEMTDKQAWAAIPANRHHYWRQPNANFYKQQPVMMDWGWSFPQMIEFARQRRKPIAVDETGTGTSGAALGPADDPEFPKFLATVLTEARAQGVTVRSVSIWDAKVSDGDWNFRGGSKPLAAAAWRRWFGEPDATSARTVAKP